MNECVNEWGVLESFPLYPPKQGGMPFNIFGPPPSFPNLIPFMCTHFLSILYVSALISHHSNILFI